MSRVLLVEDYRAFSESLALLLDMESDVKVIGRCGSAAECRSYLASEGGFDVAVVDLYLPDTHGSELIGELRESCPDAPVLVLTASFDPADHDRAREAGAHEVLSKTTNLRKIIAAVRRLADAS